MIKNKNWHNNTRTLKTKKYLKQKVSQIKNKNFKYKKTSFIPFVDLQNIVEQKPNDEIKNEIDFFAKDVRKKNISFLNFTANNFLFDRY